jgi:hypothetical protein
LGANYGETEKRRNRKTAEISAEIFLAEFFRLFGSKPKNGRNRKTADISAEKYCLGE